MYSKFAMVALAAVMSLSACKEDKVACTPEEAQKKTTEMVAKMQELATTNPEKLAAVAAKAAELQADLSGAATDPAKACDAVDALSKAME